MTTHEIHTYLCDPEKPELRYFPHAVAETLSDLAAVLLYDIHGRLKRKKKPLIRDGHEWIYDTLQEFAIAHPYASESGVRRAFLALHEAGFIVIEKTGKFNRKKYDFKWWYRLTVKGKKAATIRLMRFAPEVAVALGIPKALLLESFRYNLHKIDNEGSVLMDPAEMPIPYSCKTIQRHLGEFVKQEILQKHPEDKNRYLLPDPDEGDNSNEPFTVPIDRLLPELTAGDVALLVGHSGVGKTSYSCFLANQYAASGKKVLYLSLEEPPHDIRNRMMASEFGVSYSALHQGNAEAMNAVTEGRSRNPERTERTSANLKIADMTRTRRKPDSVLAAINTAKKGGFSPDIVIIDQLEFIDAISNPEDVGRAIPAARQIRECLGERTFVTLVIHQVNGECEWSFAVCDISGGEEVARHFDCVIGIGREFKDSPVLRLFPLSGDQDYEITMDAEFAHMRFRPKI